MKSFKQYITEDPELGPHAPIGGAVIPSVRLGRTKAEKFLAKMAKKHQFWSIDWENEVFVWNKETEPADIIDAFYEGDVDGEGLVELLQIWAAHNRDPVDQGGEGGLSDGMNVIFPPAGNQNQIRRDWRNWNRAGGIGPEPIRPTRD